MVEDNMILYYGSKTLFKKPIYGSGNPTNDYGLGFYLTPSYESGRMWAAHFENDGYNLKFDMKFDGMNILNLDSTEEVDILKWITLLVKHRFDRVARESNAQVISWLIENFDVDISNYDVIIGYRADDAYFTYSRDFVEGKLSIEKLSEALKLGNLGLQYVLMSRRAFERIEFKGYEIVHPNNEYENLRKDALNKYHRLKQEDDLRKNRLITELMKQYDKRQ